MDAWTTFRARIVRSRESTRMARFGREVRADGGLKSRRFNTFFLESSRMQQAVLLPQAFIRDGGDLWSRGFAELQRLRDSGEVPINAALH